MLTLQTALQKASRRGQDKRIEWWELKRNGTKWNEMERMERNEWNEWNETKNENTSMKNQEQRTKKL